MRGGGPNGAPSIEAYCPFGGVEDLYQFLTTGGFVRHIELSAMVLLAAVLLLTLFFSRGFCGWICPFGSLQEWLGLLGRRFFRKRYNPTGPWKRRLRWLKYPILAVIIVFTWRLGTLGFRPYDPFLAFFHLGNGLSEMPYAYARLLLLGLFATIGASHMAGKWRTKPELVSFADQMGKLNAAQIRGWMTLNEISAGYRIPLDELLRLGKLPPSVDGATSRRRAKRPARRRPPRLS